MTKVGGFSSSLILFDGVCNFCCFWVRFLIRRDPGKRFRFAPLQSAAGQETLNRLGLQAGSLTTMILVEGDRHYTKSSAALQIARRMRWPWPLLFPLVLIPAPIRDLLYDFVAGNRTRWFGRREICMVPAAELKERFLD
ncbi:MAG: thiol-disulfide oxidoreductase DCC family protein [Candidatus Omnitrophica bacterium]|nr:thiol-disulfide oxidoreductase DCC family protein [Candidatus Omnitrophota bacterium]